MEVLIMTDLKGKGENAKDKVVGGVKEAVGKITNNERLELKGKIQSSKPDIGKKSEDIQEGIAGNINEFIDKKKENKK